MVGRTAVLAAGLLLVASGAASAEAAAAGELRERMLRAAETMRAATAAIRAEKEARGLLQPAEIDPNRTGLVGPEYTEITTSLGVLEAKRTATNPDLAAALVREIARLEPRPGDGALVVLSGSFPGANVAALAAVEAAGLRPVVVSSLGASMFGATDPAFGWLEMEASLRERGVLDARSLVAVLGGSGGVGRNMEAAGADALKASAARLGVPLLDRRPLAALIEALESRAVAAAGGIERLTVAINAGGAVIALGTCDDIDPLASGLIRAPPPCTEGTPGLIVRLARRGVPVFHILNLRRLAPALGLPYDPLPLPAPGENRALYPRPTE